MQHKKTWGHYSEEFKWRIVQEVLSGKYGKEEAKKIYGIGSNCAILYWMRKYSGHDDYRYANTSTNDIKSMQSSKEIKELKARIDKLQEELRRAELRADLWQKMIEVAEQQLKVDIKKKYGAQLLKHAKGKTTH